jgi:hypothetical protein
MGLALIRQRMGGITIAEAFGEAQDRLKVTFTAVS